MGVLDQACRRTGVKPWVEFQDNSEMVAQFGETISPLFSNPVELIQTIEASLQAVTKSRISLDDRSLAGC